MNLQKWIRQHRTLYEVCLIIIFLVDLGARGVEDVDQVTPEYVVLSSDNRAYYKLAQSGGRKSLRTRIAEQEVREIGK